jgi:UDP-glucose 4-epimerase
MSPALELAGRRALVTGGRGFIGSHLCDRLMLEGAEVHATSRAAVEPAGNGVRWWQTDLLDPPILGDMLRQVRPDFVFHLSGHVSAAPQIEHVLPTYHGLLSSTVNLLTLLSSEVACSRIVLTGSLTEPLAGQMDTPPSSPYAAAKWAAGAYGRMVHALYRTPVVIARPFMGYGPRQHPSKVIPYAISTLAQGKPPSFGSGTWATDWIYIDDVIEGIIRVATAPRLEGATLDLGSGALTPIKDVIQRIVALMGTSVQPRFGTLPDRVDEVVRVADVSATYERLGWRPSISLDRGLAMTVRWFTNAAAGKKAGAVGP